MAKYDEFPESFQRYENLQSIIKLREIVRRLWHVEVCFADEDGFVVDHARGKISPSRNQFCHKCLFDKEGLKKCDRTVRRIKDDIKEGVAPEGGVFDHCHAGFKYVAVPVHVKGEFRGLVFGGGFLTEEPTEEKKKEILESTETFRGTEIADQESALAEVPRLSDAELRSFMEIISFGIEEVTHFHGEVTKREDQIRELHDALEERYAFHSIVGRATAMRTLYRLLDKLSDSEATVLVQGENGTGKEMVAKAIHYNSPRRDRRFVSQNCSAFHENLLDSELFGHVKGSFTGAIRDKKGLFEVANGGTFFMDEIGDMSPALQVKLLRVIQEGSFIPVGGTEPRQVNVRIIAATNRDLRKMVDEGFFREDLYYRINVINIYVPPLRERREDVPLLVEHFLQKYARTPKERKKRFSPQAMDALIAYQWPGNVRQLENEVQRAMVISGTSETIPREMLSSALLSGITGPMPAIMGGKLKETMQQVEKQVLMEGLRRCRWNKSRLSRELGISRATLIWKIEKYGLTRESHA